MQVKIEISDAFTSDIKYELQRKVNMEVEKHVIAHLAKIDMNKLISDNITHTIEKSKYITDNVVRNFVQQKIAKELAEKVFKDDK